MVAIAITTLLWVITLFGCPAVAKLEFFPQALPEWCSVEGIERKCDGMCAFENDVALLWCCRPLDPHCDGKAQTCIGAQGDSDQTFCEASGTKWCCNKQYETCGTTANTCTSTFQSPFRISAKGGIDTLPSDGTPLKNSASSSSELGESVSRPISNTPSTGTIMTPVAITGIAICGVVTVMATIGAFILLRRGSAGAAKDVRHDGSTGDEPYLIYEADLEKHLPVVSTPVEVHVRGG